MFRFGLIALVVFVLHLCATHLGVETSFHNQQLCGNFGSLPLGCSSYSLIYHRCCGLGNLVYKHNIYIHIYTFGSVNVCTFQCYQLSVKNLFHFSTSFSADLRPCRDASNIYCHKKRRGYRSIEFGFGFGLQWKMAWRRLRKCRAIMMEWANRFLKRVPSERIGKGDKRWYGNSSLNEGCFRLRLIKTIYCRKFLAGSSTIFI